MAATLAWPSGQRNPVSVPFPPRPKRLRNRRAPPALQGRARSAPRGPGLHRPSPNRSEEHTSELQSLMRISYAVFCLKKKKKTKNKRIINKCETSDIYNITKTLQQTMNLYTTH